MFLGFSDFVCLVVIKIIGYRLNSIGSGVGASGETSMPDNPALEYSDSGIGMCLAEAKKPRDFTRLTQEDGSTYKILVICLHFISCLLIISCGNLCNLVVS